MKKLFRYLTLVAVVMLSAGALATIAFTRALVNPSIYDQALSQSGIYPVMTDILVTKATAYLVKAQKELVADLATNITPQNQIVAKMEPMAVVFLNSLIDKQTGIVVNQVVQNAQLEKNIQNGVEKGINYATGWLAGTQPDPKFFAYLPEPERLEQTRAEGIASFAVRQIKQEIGIADLPPCTSNDQVAQNLRLLATGKVSEITCYSPQIRDAASRAATVVTPKLAQTQLAVTINDYLEKYQVKQLANNLFDALLQLSRFKQDLYNLRSTLVAMEAWAGRALWGSLVLLVIGLVLTEKRRLRTLFLTYMWVGMVMTVGALTYTIAATQVVKTAIPETPIAITDPAISLVQKQNLASSMEMVGVLVVKDLASSTQFVGMAITLISLLGLLIVHLLARSQAKHTPIKPQEVGLFDETVPHETTSTKHTPSKKKSKAKKK